MKKLIAIDPGDRWVGVAFFETEEAEPWTKPGQETWRCVDVQELDPDTFAGGFAESLLDGDLDTVVFERFRLYEDKSSEQVGSEFATSQLIGVIKYLTRCYNLHAEAHAGADRDGKMLQCELPGGIHNDPDTRPKHVVIHGQMADIKKPTTGILRHKKIKSVAKPISRELYQGRDHVLDAELHGWHYILNVAPHTGRADG